MSAHVEGAPQGVRVRDLIPGDVVVFKNQSGVCVNVGPHPVYARLELVIWRLRDGGYSFDALDERQVLDGVTVDTSQREKAIQWALGFHAAREPEWEVVER